MTTTDCPDCREFRRAILEFFDADREFGVLYGDDRDDRNHDRCIAAENSLRKLAGE